MGLLFLQSSCVTSVILCPFLLYTFVAFLYNRRYCVDYVIKTDCAYVQAYVCKHTYKYVCTHVHMYV